MTINFEMIPTLTIDRTENDNNAFDIVDGLLANLAEILDENDYFKSCKTGEIISGDELARVRGVISGLAENYRWNIHRN